MRWDDVCAAPVLAVGPGGRSRWAQDGYLAFAALIESSDLDPLCAALDMIIEQSRNLAESTHLIDVDEGHTAEAPRLRRAACIDDVDAVFWNFCSQSVLVDIAADILGPNVRFRDAFANLKWSSGGAAVEWHQDLAFYPHTNTGTCQFIVLLDQVTSDRGPLQVIPGSHKGPMYSHYAPDGRWVGAIDPADFGAARLETAVELIGPAGSVSVHHGLMLHYSAPNYSDTSRPALVITYSAADSVPYTAPPYQSSHYGDLVRGIEPGTAHHEDMTMILPPDWTHGYTSIFAHQDETTRLSQTPKPPAT